MPPRLTEIELVVEDMGRSLAFYRRLGLDIPATSDSESHVEVELPGGLRLSWDTVEWVHQAFDPDYKQIAGNQIDLQFECEDPSEVDTVYTELIDAGYVGVHAPANTIWQNRYATVSDPDGNHVDLFAPLQTS